MKLISIALTLTSLILPGTCQQQVLRPQSISSPEFDLSSFNNNEIGFLGSFDALSFYKYHGESNFTNQNNLTNNLYYTTGRTDQEFVSLGEIQGTLDQIVPMNSEGFVLLGNFSSIGDYNVSSPAIYNISSSTFTSIDTESELSGNVYTAYYDSDEEILYLGGDVEYNETQGVVLYNLSNATLQSTLFEGFGDDSTVNSIIKIGSNIIFGGQFSTLGLPELLSSDYNTSNLTVESAQMVSLRYASISSSDDSSNADILVCPNGEEWSVSGAQSATVDITLPFSVTPSKFRIYNSQDDASDISIFRVITSPSNSIMNLSYVDPSTGELSYCDAWCPLLNATDLEDASSNTSTTKAVQFYDSSIMWDSTYQEFALVDQVSVEGVTFQALSSYGSNIALAGFEIYQSVFSTYANNSLNEPSCSSISNYSYSETTGNWNSAGNNYLINTADITDGIPDVGVTFHPNISYAGYYSILLYTPGCSTDNTCDTRGIVNVTIYDDETNEVLESALIYQTNNAEKYDSIYDGHLNNSINIEMTLYSSVLSGSTDTITMVADRVAVSILSIDPITNSNGSIAINGLFEYSPLNFTQFNAANISEATLVGNTTINKLGSYLSDDANVQFVQYNDSLIIGGDFESIYGDNLFELQVSNGTNSTLNATVEVLDGGLDGAVSLLRVVDNGIIILGDFSSTNNDTSISLLVSGGSESLENAAFYNGSWYSFGSSINSESVSNITLNGEEFWAFDSDIWSADNNTWYNGTTLLSFNASSSGYSDNATLFSGLLRVSDFESNKGVLLSDDSSSETNITKDTLTNSTINFGLFINESLSVFGGEFTTESDYTNLILVNDNETQAFAIDWDSNSSVSKLFAYDDQLFIGTSGAGGSISSADVEGVMIYQLNSSSFASNQPDSLSNSNGSVQVNEFGIFNNTYLVVGGNFDSAGSVDCSGFCFYNLNESSWDQLIDGFSGTVNAFRFLNNTIVAGGDFTYDDDSLKLFTYDFNSTDHSNQPDHFSDIDNEVKKFILVDNSTSGRIIISGDNFISAYDGSSWNSIDDELSNSTIFDITLLDLTDSNDSNNGSYFNSSQVLLASGNLTISGYGYANVAYFNSTDWLPYLITTHGRSTTSVNSIFMNKDMSSLYISGSVSNSTHPSTSSSSAPSSSTTSSSTGGKKSGKMDRGFIVLVGLACAIGTMALIGAAVAGLLYAFRTREYSPIEPRVNETEMLDTVPPEGLFKHV